MPQLPVDQDWSKSARDEVAEPDGLIESDLTQAQRARIADVAELYWVRGLKVEAVGKELGISRSTVSRLLARARRDRIIEFIVHRGEDSSGRLSQALQLRYGVAVSVPELDTGSSSSVRRSAVGREAAMWLSTFVESGAIIAVSWGSTVEAVSSQLRHHPTPESHVVQLHGSGNVANLGENYAAQILKRFGSAFDAQVHLFPVPAVFDSARTLRAMWKESSIRRVLEIRDRTGILVTSVGTPDAVTPGRLYASGYLNDADIQELARQRTVGNVASVFFREDGSTGGISVNARSTGLPFGELKKIPKRFFVVADPLKAHAIHAALRAGLVTHLVIDPLTAKALLELGPKPALDPDFRER